MTATARALSAEPASASVAFVDLAGFSAITDIFGDRSAASILDGFEGLVRASLGQEGRILKWIGDEAMLVFPGPEAAIRALGRLLPACRSEPRLPLTRAGLHHGPVLWRSGDVVGGTVNVAARIAARAAAGQLLATAQVAQAAAAMGVATRPLGEVSLRSVAMPVPLFAIELAQAADPAWIDPVCKMHAPLSAFAEPPRDGPWFCSPRCRDAWQSSPATYARAGAILQEPG